MSRAQNLLSKLRKRFREEADVVVHEDTLAKKPVARSAEQIAIEEEIQKDALLTQHRSKAGLLQGIKEKIAIRFSVDQKIVNYIRENPGAPFIIAFMGFLMVAAVRLSMDMRDLANEFAVYAYYALVVGVVAQIIGHVVNHRESKAEREYEKVEHNTNPNAVSVQQSGKSLEIQHTPNEKNLISSNKMVSVVIPTKNSAPTLDHCLESLARQSYKKFEIIVVDNYSTDNTREIARRYTDKVYTAGSERSAQVNYGIKKAKGDIIYRVDSDFVLEHGVLAEAVNCIERGYHAVLIHNSSDPTISFWAKVRKFERDMYAHDETNVAARFVRRDVMHSVGLFDECLTAAEDYDLHNRLISMGYKIGRISSKEVHLGEPRSLTDIARKHYYYGQTIGKFLKKNPKIGIKQLSPVRNAHLRNWRLFIKHPMLAMGFIIYQLVRYTSSVTGFLSENFARRQN